MDKLIYSFNDQDNLLLSSSLHMCVFAFVFPTKLNIPTLGSNWQHVEPQLGQIICIRFLKTKLETI